MHKPEYFDIHSHLNDLKFKDEEKEVIHAMEKAGVATFVVGTDEQMSKDAVRLASEYESVHAVVGCHPTDTDELFRLDTYRELLKHPKTVGVGECGLDYLRLEGGKVDVEKKRQKDVFEAQLELAVEFERPLMIHCREAHEDLLPILESKKREYGERLWGNIHFFTAGTEEAKRYYDINFTTSFTGVLTFTHDYDEVVRYAPLSMIQSETDAPYVAPVPHRGDRNEPAYVVEVVKQIAALRNEDLEMVKKALVENTSRVFKL